LREFANAPAPSNSNPGGASSNPPVGGSFGSFGLGAASQPQQQGSLFAGATSQPAQSGGAFGASVSQPAPGLFGSTTSQPASSGFFGAATSQPASGGLFGSTSSQPPKTGGLFGTSASQPAPSSGLFGMAASQATPSGGLFGSTTQSTQGGGLFGAASSQPAPSGGLFGAAPQAAQGGGLFGGTSSNTSQSVFGATQAAQGTSLLAGSRLGGAAPPAGMLNLGQQSTLGTSSSNARIDLEHLRPTTKFDQLTEELQREILNLDTAILNEINRCNEVSDLLPTIEATGSNIPNDVAYVTQKLEEVETGLENDAEEVQNLKEHIVKKDANEAKVCFREVDRLKMPSQYQASVTGPAASVSGVYGGHGLSGWWNHPQTLQRTLRGGTGTGGSRSLQLPGDEDEDTLAGAPANVIDFFDRRTVEMRKSLAENKALLTEIEEFVISVENKIAAKQQELMGREGRAPGAQGDDDQVGLFRYVFGEFERSLYEVADKVGGARDGVQDLVLGRVGDADRTNRKLAW
jgi:nucleoporin p58/p45